MLIPHEEIEVSGNESLWEVNMAASLGKPIVILGFCSGWELGA
jgi:hypothetical protein